MTGFFGNLATPLSPAQLNDWKGVKDAQGKTVGAGKGTKREAVFRHKLSMFLAGLIMLTPHRIAILCANHVVARFHLPPATVPLFIYKVHNPMELSSFIGQFLSTIMTLLIDTCAQEEPFSGPAGAKSKSKRVLSCLFIWAMFFSCVLAYIFFVTGDDFGHFEQFYWCIILITLCNGLFSSYAFGTNFNSALYGAGLPLSGFFTFVFHKICVWVSKVKMWDDFDYTIVEKQIFWINISLLFTAGWWTFDQCCQFDKTIPGNSDIKELFTPSDVAINQWSPVLMLAFSLGTVYAFYPSISPYQFVDWNTAEQIDLWIVVVSSIPTLLIAMLDEVDNATDHGNKLGPGGTGPGSWGKFVNDDGTDVKELMRIQLRILHNHMTNKKNYTEKSSPGVSITYSANDNKFGRKVNEARKTVDSAVGQTSDKAADATGLQNALNTGGEINQVVTEWANIQNIGNEDKTATSNKAANDAITEIGKYTNTTLAAHSTIGQNHTTAKNAFPHGHRNWNPKSGGDRWHWHLIGWLSGIPYMSCMHIFISILHFPDGRISKFIHARPKLLWIISITFNTVEELMEIISFSGAGKQSTQPWMMYNGAVGQFNGMFFLFIVNISMSPI